MKKFLISIVLIFSFIFIVKENSNVGLTNITVNSKNLPSNFNGLKVAHISDYHNSNLSKKTVDILKEANPDIIAITGDLIDSRRTDIPKALEFIDEAVKISPVYYAPGNHESRIEEYPDFEKELIDRGVTVLRNNKVYLKNGDEKITVMGVDDPEFGTDVEKEIQELKDDNFTILLSHKPHLFDIYVSNQIDLTLSGHAHGGQFRLPFIGGLFAPHQGFLPKYTEGLHTKDNSSMVISRGIGSSQISLRFNNNPEVVLIELKNGSPSN